MRKLILLTHTVILLAVFATSCTPESVNPQAGNSSTSPDLHASVDPHPLLPVICSPMIPYPLAGVNGDQLIPANLPQGGQDWGSVTLYNGENENGKATIAMDFQLASSWMIKEIKYYFGKKGYLKLSPKGEPEINNSWMVAPVNPLVNATQLRVGLNGFGLENVLVARLEVGQLDFLNPNNGIDPSTIEYVWVYNDQFSGPRPNAQYFEAGYTTVKCN